MYIVAHKQLHVRFQYMSQLHIMPIKVEYLVGYLVLAVSVYANGMQQSQKP